MELEDLSIERTGLLFRGVFGVTTASNLASPVFLFFSFFFFSFFFVFFNFLSTVLPLLIAISALSSIRLTRAAGFKTGSSSMALAVASVIEAVFFFEIIASVRLTASSWLSLSEYFLSRVKDTSKMCGKVDSAAFFLKDSAVEIASSHRSSF